jgi:phosphoribosylformylglycinamidine synthase
MSSASRQPPAASPTQPPAFWEIEVSWKEGFSDPRAAGALGQIRDLLPGAAEQVGAVTVSDLYYFLGEGLTRERVEAACRLLLSDPVVQEYSIREPGQPAGGPGAGAVPPAGLPGATAAPAAATVLKKPGVMDPVEASLLQGLEDLGITGVKVRAGTRYAFGGRLDAESRRLIAEKVLSNPAIEDVAWTGAGAEGGGQASPFRGGAPYRFHYRDVPLAGLSGDELLRVSREGQLSLSLIEMEAVRDHFQRLGRAPSDCELETIAQTWSEHCSHKTFTGLIEHHAHGRVERIDNLLRETIRKATEEIAAPWCLSVFADNAGVIALDDEQAITFKVETHNHPSAIEPYGGAGTGIGGVIRDTLGTGLGAKPIASTDVFCFAPLDIAPAEIPPGALHPLRVLRGVVSGVRDYGNRMGIPTVSGALYFDRRYAGNPLVFCGSVGIIPRDAIAKRVEPGDRIYVAGGRTGRDGIHGATFSSIELTEASETVSSGAVQIGNAITEKKLLDLVLAARDRRLFRALTDCGAGGLSSAVGEMGADTGARVELERVPLKYEGLSYWEIWVSEAQERMVLAVPPEHAAEFEALARAEEVEVTDIGEFTATGRLVLSYQSHTVCDLGMEFLHRGRPRPLRRSVFARKDEPHPRWAAPASPGKVLRAILASPNVASKEWIIRQYDHEVQGRSVLKPLQGIAEDGPGDAAALAPCFGSRRGIVIGCGMNPRYGDLDPYRMALSAVDEAVRNVVAAGGDPDRTAILDNFAWGNTDRPETLGALVEAARACRDAAIGLRTPFISGKDSLQNEFRAGGAVITIPPSLLISSVSVVEDVARLVSMDLKAPGNRLILAGLTRRELGGSHYFGCLGIAGGDVPGLDPAQARRLHLAVARAIREGLILAAHDLSEGGLAVAAAEMAFAGGVGAEIRLANVPREGCDRDDEVLFSESNARYLLEVRPAAVPRLLSLLAGLPAAEVGETAQYGILRIVGLDGQVAIAEALKELKALWRGTLDLDRSAARPAGPASPAAGHGTGNGKGGAA